MARPRKYFSAAEQREGNNAVRRKRRKRAREAKKAVDSESLKIKFEYCSNTDANKISKAELAKERSDALVPWRPTASNVRNGYPNTSLVFGLCDPLFQDFGDDVRFYIRHFSSNVCQDLVSYDTPGQNPYRMLIASIKDSPLLISVMVANSATHLANLHSSKTAPALLEYPTSVHSVNDQPVKATSIVSQESGKHVRNALSAKSKALQMLAKSISTTTRDNLDVVLAAILLLINYELISSGKDDWKVHVEGAKLLIDRFHTPYIGVSESDSLLRDFAVTDCLTYYVLGSVLRPRKDPTASSNLDLDVLPFCQRAEANSYVSCPAVLLQTALAASKLLDADSISIPQLGMFSREDRMIQASDLLDTAMKFPVHEWAASIQGIAAQSDLESRIHVAVAHRSAVCLYINSAVPYAALLSTSDMRNHVDTIITNLSMISQGDKLLKGTSWPTFIAGAEAMDPEHRQWVVTRLDELWNVLPWGYLDTAREMLNVIWSRASTKESEAEAEESWLGYLRRLGHDWIVV